MEDLIALFIVVGLIVLGLLAGRVAERRHKRSLDRREAADGPVLTNLRRLPPDARVADSRLCIGCVVIASDYFKSFTASLKTIAGGRMGMLETLMERGRREAVQRMRDQAATIGADLVLNIRVETSMIMRSGNKVAPAEVIAYGTAVKFAS